MEEILGERVCLREIEEKDHVPLWNMIYGEDSPEWKKWDAPLVRIGLAMWSGNHRMIRSAEKLGMKMEARIRKARLHQDTYYDAVRMGVLREEWPIVARTDEEEVHECK